jgi:hypothetical protein
LNGCDSLPNLPLVQFPATSAAAIAALFGLSLFFRAIAIAIAKAL